MEDVVNKYRFMVCVRSLIYNHEKYINDCLQGLMMQETDFPVVFLLEDDASTDKTTQILTDFVNREFAIYDKDIARTINFDGAVTTFARHRTKEFWYVVYIKMKYNHYGKFSRDAYNKEWMSSSKYIAYCEGDDYWTDPLKLQRQVDFLEEHEEYSMSTENGRWIDIRTQESRPFSSEQEREVTFEEMLIKRRFSTASVLYRRCYQEEIAKLKPPTYDTLIWACLAKQGKIHYNPVISSVYRRGDGVTEKDKIGWAYTVRSFNISLCENFDVPAYIKKIRDKDVLENIYVGIKTAYKQNRYKDVVRLFFYSERISPGYWIKRYVKRKK